MEVLETRKVGFWRKRRNVWGLYLLVGIPLVYVIIFNYIPMYGVIMAFKQFQPRLGIWKSPWVGFYHFQRFLGTPIFFNLLRNTLILSFYGLIAGFPFPILMALAIHHGLAPRFKKSVQTITFAPHFFSSVIIVGMVTQILAMRTGGVNILLKSLGFGEINFMGVPGMFPHIYIWSGIWQGTGYSAILYIATLSGVDPNLHEAAIIDGATIWQRIWCIDLAVIRPIIIISLILSVGGILGTGFEKNYLLQTSLNLSTSETITTYVYKVGLGTDGSLRADYSFGTAIGLFQNVIGVILTLTVNKIAKTLSGESFF
jgi:ABC-type polysaccharide transport system permease subunit